MKLIIIAASGRAMAASANNAGFSFCLIDRFCDWDALNLASQSGNPKHEFHQIAGWDEVAQLIDCVEGDAVVIGGGLECRVNLVRKIEQQFPLLGTSSQQLARLIHTDSLPVLAAAIQRAGGKWPQSITYRRQQPATVTGRWLIKNLAGGGGSGVRRLEEDDASITRQIESQFYLQQRIDGPTISALFLSCLPKPETDKCSVEDRKSVCHLIGCTEQMVGIDWLGASEFGYCGSIGPMHVNHKLRSILAAIGAELAAEFQLQGFFGIDFMVNFAGVWPVDINPRIPASAEIYELLSLRLASSSSSTLFSTVRLQVESCLGNRDIAPQSFIPDFQSWRVAKGVLFHQGKERLLIDQKKFDRLLEFAKINEDESALPSLADIPNPRTVIEPRHPILTVITEGRNRVEAKKNLQRQVDTVKDLLYRE